MKRALALALLLSSAPLASASTRRLAIVVGNNYATSEKTQLHYAEDDAARIAGVLSELGGVAPQDLSLLRSLGAKDLRAAFSRAGRSIASGKSQALAERSMLIFFFSGHSDGTALELGPDRISFDELRRLLVDTGADVRVAIIDSCRSGALLAVKGSKPAPPFNIELNDDSTAAGTVLLTSSAANEEALESRELKGSFFTHHLVAGLRGAADTSGDGRVTLSEVYRYAYAQTVSATAETAVATQHPGYDFRMSGVGEIVLAQVTDRTATLALPADFDRALVVDVKRNEIAAEVPTGVTRPLAFAPGTYQLKLWRGPQLFEGSVALAPGTARRIAWADLAVVQPLTATAAKGSGASLEEALGRGIALFEAFDDEHAAEALRALLARHPPARMAARAHVYLALIELNASHAEQARGELKQAMLADPTVELPINSSPKAQLALGEARRELKLEVDAAPPEAQAPAPVVNPVLVEAVPLVQPPEPAPRRSHVLALTLGGVAVAAAAVAVFGGAEVASYSSAVNGLSNGGSASSSQLGGYNASFWAVGWIVAAVVGAAAAGGAVLTW